MGPEPNRRENMNLQDTYSAMHQEAFLLTLAIKEKLQNLSRLSGISGASYSIISHTFRL